MTRPIWGLILSLALFSVFSTPSIASVGDESHKGELPAGLLRLGDGVMFPQYALVVDKSKRKIHVLDNSSGMPLVVETFDSDLGKNSGDKHSTGDYRTPEGIYFLERLLEGPTLDAYKYGTRAFTTNYPNFFDQKDGKSGYGIWLHAIDDKVGLERGSQGCVVVRNETIKKISQYITLFETPLMIFDKVQWVPAESLKKDSSEILDMLSQWRKSWESKDIENYIGFYSDHFIFGKMNKAHYKRYKKDLAQRYKEIKVSLSMPVIYEHKDNMVVRFLQDYASPDHADFGEKTLYLRKENGKFYILGETWQEATDPKTKALLAGDKLCCQSSSQMHN